MDTSTEEEARPILAASDVSRPVGDARRPYEKQLAAHLILASYIFERSAFLSLEYGLPPSLLSKKTLNWTRQHTSAASYIFSGTIHISTLTFAVISDAKLSRVRTMAIGLPLYLTAFTLATLVLSRKICHLTHVDPQPAMLLIHEKCAEWIIPTLIFTAIGAGALRSNLIIFGADQIRDSSVQSRYIDKCVVAANVASIIETLLYMYIRVEPENDFTFYIIAISMLFFAVLLFFIGWRYYKHATPYDSVLTYCIPVVRNAFQTWRQNRSTGQAAIPQDSTLPRAVNEFDQSVMVDGRPSSFLDFAKVTNNGKYQDRLVDDVKSLRNALIIFILVIPYRLIYNQLLTNFAYQGDQMKSPPPNTHIADWMLISEFLIVIVGIFILNVFMNKYLRSQNRSLTIATKFVIGMCFAFLTMCLASGVEAIRQDYCPADRSTNVSGLTIYAQFPQHISMGLSQLFASLAIYEFAYFAAPRSAQSLFMGFNFSSVGIVSFIQVGYSSVLRRYLIEFNFTCSSVFQYGWRYTTYFLVFAVVQLISILFFVVCQKRFRMIKVNSQKIDDNQLLPNATAGPLD